MRKIRLSDGKEITVEPLKGKDVRALMLEEEEGFAPMFKALERAGFSQEVTDDMAFPDVMALYKAVIAETYGVEQEIKNS